MFNFFCHIVRSVAEFLIEHLVGSRCSEAFETVDGPVVALQGEEGGGEAGGEGECGYSLGQYALAILFALTHEEADGGHRHHAGFDTVFLELLGYIA